MTKKPGRLIIQNILDITRDLSLIKDLDSLLDRILSETRRLTGADGGTIYLKRGNRLIFDYFQNDTLVQADESSKKYLYAKQEMGIDRASISGYVAATKKPLLISNAYHLDPSLPFSFNRSFDTSAHYRTCSVLAIPLLTSQKKLIGVIQIINKKDSKGLTVPFKNEDLAIVSHFADHAASAIERAKMTREMILRMVRLAEMRDPKETGAHVNRVGSVAVEIYQKWGAMKAIPPREIKSQSDILKIAAMLHDVGKVAISDNILKKAGKLTDEEFQVIKYHTVFGAQLFRDSTSEWDEVSAAIILNHHERWDGAGYPGHIVDDPRNDTMPVQGKKDEDIPLMARVVALADVYDALHHQRCYKSGWPIEKVIEYISKQRGRQFDPELVDAFLSILDIISAIEEKFRE